MSQTKLGLCVICGSRVHRAEKHLKRVEGYCHKNCISKEVTAKA
jgi:hypothetical protein